MNLAVANESLAHISNVLIYSSMAVYTLAFLALIAEWIFGTRSKVGRTAAALAARGGSRATTVTAEVRVAKTGGAGTAVLERPKVVGRAAEGARDIADGPGAHGGDEQGDLYGRIAVSLVTLGFLLSAGAVVSRSLSVRRAPWGNMYEFSTTFATVAVGVYLALLLARKNVRWIGLPLVTTVLLDLGVAVTWLYTESAQLVPALHSYWLWIHVSTAIFCGAVLYLGAVSSLGYLLRDRYELRLADGGVSALERRLAEGARGDSRPLLWIRVMGNDIMSRLPAAATLDRFAYRVNAAVFPLWTFTIIAGAIWAGDAWGRYWGWDPKEVWSFITWTAYACYLHARATAGWKGRKAAYIALFAFATYIFNYYGVNFLFGGKHSYSGV
ncbi:c-type cytochrome biogenesis protein CcsB [Streptomyces sp. UNOC14_S4]|uniref:c-type cytochrome biogenesis protein CcsB n=1 Tax=Streptomyces sp. UNOC14_S4 TaxID=2872340 RepID=UPI001E53A4AB|nr:c-type cytochrome biogenesis protein CcsB [Streptomyces sp. UNOC14_S4]MCC3769245.1 c-type cytochrome biogenesis protein CcsB [Streptomyces sp. UNOC14_S4]